MNTFFEHPDDDADVLGADRFGARGHDFIELSDYFGDKLRSPGTLPGEEYMSSLRFEFPQQAGHSLRARLSGGEDAPVAQPAGESLLAKLVCVLRGLFRR